MLNSEFCTQKKEGKKHIIFLVFVLKWSESDERRGGTVEWVEPIRDIEIVNEIAADLKEQSRRNYIMFAVGIYCGPRISELLRLKVKDVRNKEEISWIEPKTGNRRFYPLPPPIKKVLNDYCRGRDKNEYLIRKSNVNRPISRYRAWEIISECAKAHGLSHIGTHSMRKTFGYHFYKQTGDVAMLMQIFGHSSELQTLRYIGVTHTVIKEQVKSFRPFKI